MKACPKWIPQDETYVKNYIPQTQKEPDTES